MLPGRAPWCLCLHGTQFSQNVLRTHWALHVQSVTRKTMDDRQATFVPTVRSDVRTECSHGSVRTPPFEHDGDHSSSGAHSPPATDDAVPPGLRRAPRGSSESSTPAAACGGDGCATAHGRGRDRERDPDGLAPASEPARSGHSSTRARQAAADTALSEPVHRLRFIVRDILRVQRRSWALRARSPRDSSNGVRLVRRARRSRERARPPRVPILLAPLPPTTGWRQWSGS